VLRIKTQPVKYHTAKDRPQRLGTVEPTFVLHVLVKVTTVLLQFALEVGVLLLQLHVLANLPEDKDHTRQTVNSR